MLEMLEIEIYPLGDWEQCRQISHINPSIVDRLPPGTAEFEIGDRSTIYSNLKKKSQNRICLPTSPEISDSTSDLCDS